MKKKSTQIAAFIALFAILWSVFWTWAMIIFETFTWKTNQEQSLSQEELSKLFQTLSWTTNTWTLNNTWVINSQTWVKINLEKTLTWTTK